MKTDIPASMRVIEITQPGAPDVLRPTTRPTPEPGPGEVLIAVEAAGVNRPDVMQRQGIVCTATRNLRHSRSGNSGPCGRDW